MTEGGTDLRILTSRDTNEILPEIRGTKRKLEISQTIEENQRIERQSAPKRRRRSKDGVVGIVKKSITRVYEYVNTFLFGCTEDEVPSVHSESVQTEALQDQAVDMSQPTYIQKSTHSQLFSHVEEKCDSEEPEILGYRTVDNSSKTLNISKDDPKSSTPLEKLKESNRQSFGFGLQASGPLSTKTAMSNIKFHGRQFAIATQEKRDAVRKSQEPSTLLDQIRRKNISAATSSSSPYRPISIIDKTFREDLARGVRRSKEGGAITRNKTPIKWSANKRSAILAAYRKDEFMKYKAILENSPAAGLKITSHRNPAINNSTNTPSRWKESSATNRTSLFQNPNASSAINITRYNRPTTLANSNRISNLSNETIQGLKNATHSVSEKITDIENRIQENSRVGMKTSNSSKSTENRTINDVKKESTYYFEGPKCNFLQELMEKYAYRFGKNNTSPSIEEKKKYCNRKSTELQSQDDEKLARRLKIIVIDSDFSETEDELDSDEENAIQMKIPEITDEMDFEIDLALRSRETIIDAYSIQIKGNDIDTLNGLNWLNDEVINFYLQMIVTRSTANVNGWPRVYATNTFFYPKLMQQGHSALKRWTRKVDIFSFDLILVPVHLGMHWCLATIDLKRKAVFYYDSMGGDNISCLDALLKYLQDEHMDKKKSPFDTSSFNSEIVKDIPQQMNGSDCGMFTCKFAEYLSRDAPISFSQEDMPYYRRRMIYEIVKNNLMYP